MTSVVEAAGTGGSPYEAVLDAGLETLSLDQEITFTPYVRVVLPLDGFVFWVRADLLSPAALYNASTYNRLAFNEPPRVDSVPAPVVAKGSLHYATDQRQEEDESYAVNRVVFTSEVELEDFNAVSPHLLYIGEVDGLRFAFSQRQSFYRQVDLFHYVGDAVYPAFATQVVDDPQQLVVRELVVSNSLPIWLALNAVAPVFPSYLVPDNIVPPWVSVHIPPESTQPLQAVPRLDRTQTHWQLVCDEVRLTFYGLRNTSVMDYVDYVLGYMADDTAEMGLMSLGVPQDEKRLQNELGVLAIKKTWTLKVSYYQTTLRDVARKFITSCVPTYVVLDHPA